MANKKTDPTTPENDPSKKTRDSSTNTITKLTAIFDDLDAKSIRAILAAGTAMLQQRTVTATDKVLSEHLEVYKEGSLTSRGGNSLVPTLILSVKGTTWEGAADFMKSVGPTLAEGGITLHARLRDVGGEMGTSNSSVSMELELVFASGDYGPLFDILDESTSTQEALEYLRAHAPNV